MNRDDVRERQWQETLQVATALKTRLPAEVRAAPSAGEIYLSRRTANFPVEWLVLEIDEQRLCLVPVDDYPLAGSQDVDLPPSMGGSAVARCGLSTWAQVSVLEPELRTAVLDNTILEWVQARCHAVKHGRLEPTLLEDVVDGDPEYQSWVAGTLCPAIDALENKPAEEKPRPSTIVEAPRTWRRWNFLTAAAVLLLMSGLSWYIYHLEGQLSFTHGRVAELERRGTEQNMRIEDEVRRRQTAEDESGRLGGLLEAARESISATGVQLARIDRELRQALDFGAAVNVQKLVFGGQSRFSRGGSRGEAVVLEPDMRSSPLTYLEVEVVDPEPYQTYRLRMVPINAGKPVAVDGLRRDGAWLRLGLSPDQLTPGEYEVRIDGMSFDSPVELDERYKLIVMPSR